MEAIFEAEALVKAFKKKAVIDGVDLAVGAGTTAVVGVERSGKTVLFDVLTGSNRPTSGTVKIYGHDVVKERGEALVCVGAVPTFPVFGRGMKVKEVVEYGCRCMGVAKAEREDVGKRVLARVGLSGAEEERAESLNVLDARRLAFALAIVGSPKALVVDDPYRALKSAERDEMARIIDDLSKDCECVLLMLTENFDTSRCGRVLRLEDGKVTEAAA